MIIVKAEGMKKALSFCFIYFKHLGTSRAGGDSACLFLFFYTIHLSGVIFYSFILECSTKSAFLASGLRRVVLNTMYSFHYFSSRLFHRITFLYCLNYDSGTAYVLLLFLK